MSKPPTFQEAMTISAERIALWDAGELSDEVLADAVGQLVGHRDGARGFFVVSLTSDSPLMDRLPETLVMQLREAGEGVVDLTARNLAMSTAMALHHERQQDQTMREGSLKVQARSLDLLKQLEANLVKEKLEKLIAGLEGKGEEKDFYDRWNYDEEQRGAIKKSLLAVAS
ncbi:MAG: hypothetical protein VKO26_10325 [Cyanobacteriota bacterium]|nr:hypothetical protein [Cyanobacteriota bacterium]